VNKLLKRGRGSPNQASTNFRAPWRCTFAEGLFSITGRNYDRPPRAVVPLRSVSHAIQHASPSVCDKVVYCCSCFRNDSSTTTLADFVTFFSGGFFQEATCMDCSAL
jgi:hypothetical protein